MKMLELLVAPTIVFLVMVAPLWIIMHYRSAKGSSRSLDQDEREAVEELLADLDKMTDRIEALESILDHDNPGWRKHSSERQEKFQTDNGLDR